MRNELVKMKWSIHFLFKFAATRYKGRLHDYGQILSIRRFDHCWGYSWSKFAVQGMNGLATKLTLLVLFESLLWQIEAEELSLYLTMKVH